MSDTRYLILLPLKFPDGTPVPHSYIVDTQVELARRFGGATLEQDLAGEIGVDPRVLSEFRTGEAELPAAALDRLLDVLGLRLMQEIPR
jgi:hypothetical protein